MPVFIKMKQTFTYNHEHNENLLEDMLLVLDDRKWQLTYGKEGTSISRVYPMLFKIVAKICGRGQIILRKHHRC